MPSNVPNAQSRDAAVPDQRAPGNAPLAAAIDVLEVPHAAQPDVGDAMPNYVSGNASLIRPRSVLQVPLADGANVT